MKRSLFCTTLLLCLAACAAQAPQAPQSASHLPFYEQFKEYNARSLTKDGFFPGFTLSETKSEDTLSYQLTNSVEDVTLQIDKEQTYATVSKNGQSCSFPIRVFLSSLGSSTASVRLVDLTGDQKPELVYLENTGGTGAHQTVCHIVDLQTMKEYEIAPFILEFMQSVAVEPCAVENGVLRCALTGSPGNVSYGEIYAAAGWENRGLEHYQYTPQNESSYYSISVDPEHSCLRVSIAITVSNTQLGNYLGEISGILLFEEDSQTFRPVLPGDVSAFTLEGSSI